MTAPPLTILHVVAPGLYGGLERVVGALAMGHQRLGQDVHVLTILDSSDSGTNAFATALVTAGVKVERLPLPARAYLRERRAVRESCRRIGATVVHTHGARVDVLDAPVTRHLGIPTVTTVHGFTGGDWKNRLYERLQRRAFRRFDAVVAVSAQIRERLVRDGVRAERVHLLPNAWADDVAFLDRAAARQALDLPADRLVLGWVGRLTREKGADVAMEALVHLIDLPVDLSFVGDGREVQDVRSRAAAAGLAARVRFHGVVPEAGRLLPAFDVLLLSSRTEGTPIVLLEAMAARVPVVATAVGGVPDMVADAEARLVPSEDPGALASAVRDVLSDRAAAERRARAAQARVERDFALAPWLDRYLAVYHSLQ